MRLGSKSRGEGLDTRMGAFQQAAETRALAAETRALAAAFKWPTSLFFRGH
jgi:hypothetical protein